jgi:hypothetical protein
MRRLVELSEFLPQNKDEHGIDEFKHSFAIVKKTYFNESARMDRIGRNG